MVREVKTGSAKKIIIEPVRDADLKVITKARYFFNWKTERYSHLFKLRLSKSEDILGVMSFKNFPMEARIEIVLLAVSKENRGKKKQYEGIAGNLIAYAAREAIKLYAERGCLLLFPKTELKPHYMKAHGMLDAGRQVFLEGQPLFDLVKTYKP